VKVLRPDIEQVIEEDMALLERLATLLDRLSRDIARLRLPEVVKDQHRTLLAELDLRLEAANTVQLRQNFAGSELLYVPRVFTELCRRNVLVLERIHGVPISDLDRLRAMGTDMKLLAERGVETFFTQVFVHNFFHADMHPGNIFVNADDPANPSYIAIDCAIIGSLTSADQEYLARNLLAFFNQDYAAVARLHLESGWIPPDTDKAAFERVIRDLCEPLFAKPLDEIFFGEFLVELFATARDFDMEVQPQLVLLQKTLLYIEGLGRQLYPELDLWETAKPFMERWMAERANPINALRALFEQASDVIPQLPALPRIITESAVEIRRLNYRLDRQAKVLDGLSRRARMRRWERAGGAGLMGLAAVLLWEPLAQTISTGSEFGTSAALLSAIFGTLLLVKT
jgi:ubiquinone biosynthesis protein